MPGASMAEDMVNVPEKPVAEPERDYRELEPAPDERPNIPFNRKPGQFKRDKFWIIDPSPDVVSLTFLPRDTYGFVDWARSIREGLIAPKDFLPTADKPPEKDPDFDKDILIRAKAVFMPDVLFPHAIHNTWLKCSVCHPKIFEMKAGATPITMTGIWKGKFCGRCHDRVAFPIRNCFKCHSVPKAKAETPAPLPEPLTAQPDGE